MSTPMQVSIQQHREKNVIAVQFPNTAELNRRFRQLTRWPLEPYATEPDTTRYGGVPQALWAATHN